MNNFEVALTKEVCIICCKEVDADIIINTKLTKKAANDVKELDGKVLDFTDTPCDDCLSDLDNMFLFIGYDPEQSNLDKLPYGFYRTGHIIGTKKQIPLIQEWVKLSVPIAYEKGYLFIPYDLMLELNLITN